MPPQPSFANPPLLERAISLQFDALPQFTNAHLGLFWNEIAREYPRVEDAPLIEPSFERFERAAKRRGLPRIRIGTEMSGRLLMRTESGERLAQIQNGRIAFNWVKVEGKPYASFHQGLPEFFKLLDTLSQFLEERKLGPLQPNQWEITYVNRIDVIESFEVNRGGWAPVLPGLLSSDAQRLGPGVLIDFSGKWHYELPPKAGKLHVDLDHGWTGDQAETETLLLHLTARGPIKSSERSEIDRCLNLGHDAIVEYFVKVTGKPAQEAWGRK